MKHFICEVLKDEKWRQQAQIQSDHHCNTNQHKHNSSVSHEFVLLLILHVATMSQILSSAYKDNETANTQENKENKGEGREGRNTLWY